MVHNPGVKHKAADAISRKPTGPSNPEKLPLSDDVASTSELTASPGLGMNPYRQSFLTGIRCVDPTTASSSSRSSLNDELTLSATSALNTVSTTWEKVKLYTTSDPNMNTLVSIIESGFPEFRHELPRDLHEYFQFRDNLCTVDGVILYKDRVVIPPQLRDDILTTLYSAHQGVTSMITRAETSVFWPGITPRHQSSTTPLQPLQPHGTIPT